MIVLGRDSFESPAVVLAPLRLGLTGGGTDLFEFSTLEGGHVVNVSTSPFISVIANYKKSTNFVFELDGELSCFDNFEDFMSRDERCFLSSIVRWIFEETQSRVEGGLEVFVRSPVGKGSGLGVSSTIVSCLVDVVCTRLLRLNLSDHEMIEIAIRIERTRMGLPGGIQDFIPYFYQGCNLIEVSGTDFCVRNINIGPAVREKIFDKVVLVDTGGRAKGETPIDDQIASIKTTNGFDVMRRIKSNSEEFYKAVTRDDWEVALDLFRLNGEEKRKLSPTIFPARVEEALEEIQTSIVAAKMNGAGGGGCLTICAKSESAKRDIYRWIVRHGFRLLPSSCIL